MAVKLHVKRDMDLLIHMIFANEDQAVLWIVVSPSSTVFQVLQYTPFGHTTGIDAEGNEGKIAIGGGMAVVTTLFRCFEAVATLTENQMVYMQDDGWFEMPFGDDLRTIVCNADDHVEVEKRQLSSSQAMSVYQAVEKLYLYKEGRE